MTRLLITLLVLFAWSPPVHAGELRLLQQKPDPYGSPRPAPGAVNVPVLTSFFLQIGFRGDAAGDRVLAERIAVRLRSRAGGEIELLRPGRQFGKGYSGRIIPSRKPQSAVAIYIEGERLLRPGTTYTVAAEARSRDGGALSEDQAT